MKFIAFLALSLSLAAAETRPLNLSLPTDNTAIFDGKPEDFYMWVPRTFEGVTSQPWTAGQYGFVRTLVRTEGDGIVARKFHEGLDIKPTKRDANNAALDEVRTIADGIVAHVSPNKGASNYGVYVVMEHDFGYGKIYSLYAHLAKITAEKGQTLKSGEPIGIMGYTGDGITRERSHLHLEINLMSSDRFDDYIAAIGSVNPHGNYNGMNLIGIDAASLFLSHKTNPAISIPTFLASAAPYFKVAVPREADLSLCERYPWLKKGDHEAPSPSWEISFTGSGIPLSVVPSHREVNKPLVTYVRSTRSSHSYYTRKRLLGTGRNATLSNSGQNFIKLLTDQFKK
ncbi:M23 family metallopeptidase [Akkermansiaceae bacterium]|nr:M23 family metallopeptidase [Akkermansiaceae bacterium]